jgi:hypothetical protein
MKDLRKRNYGRNEKEQEKHKIGGKGREKDRFVVLHPILLFFCVCCCFCFVVDFVFIIITIIVTLIIIIIISIINYYRYYRYSIANPPIPPLLELQLYTPIRYGPFDPVELWLNSLLCLNNTSDTDDDGWIYSIPSSVNSLSLSSPSSSSPQRYLPPHDVLYPPASKCSLYFVNRDCLFSFHKASEVRPAIPAVVVIC